MCPNPNQPSNTFNNESKFHQLILMENDVTAKLSSRISRTESAMIHIKIVI